MLSLFGGNDCIVQIYTYCLDFPRAFIVYEYLPGDTLARYIHGRDMRLSYLQILQVAQPFPKLKLVSIRCVPPGCPVLFESFLYHGNAGLH